MPLCPPRCVCMLSMTQVLLLLGRGFFFYRSAIARYLSGRRGSPPAWHLHFTPCTLVPPDPPHALPAARAPHTNVSSTATEQGSAIREPRGVGPRCPPLVRNAPPPLAGRSSSPRRRTPQKQQQLGASPARRRATPLRCRRGVRPGGRVRRRLGGSSVFISSPPRPLKPLLPPLAAADAAAAGAIRRRRPRRCNHRRCRPPPPPNAAGRGGGRSCRKRRRRCGAAGRRP